MKRLLFSMGLALIFTACSATKRGSTKEYGRLTVIYGRAESFGLRYFWESPAEKTEAMSFELLHQHFGVALPGPNELKVVPRDYKVIARLIESGWSLVAVNSTGAYKEDAGSYKDAITHDAVTTYHFSR